MIKSSIDMPRTPVSFKHKTVCTTACHFSIISCAIFRFGKLAHRVNSLNGIRPLLFVVFYKRDCKGLALWPSAEQSSASDQRNSFPREGVSQFGLGAFILTHGLFLLRVFPAWIHKWRFRIELQALSIHTQKGKRACLRKGSQGAFYCFWREIRLLYRKIPRKRGCGWRPSFFQEIGNHPGIGMRGDPKGRFSLLNCKSDF